jgi:hypothetical protein
MNIKTLLMGVFALSMTLGAVQAQTEVRITGATAFRAAALNTLLARFQAGGNFRYAHNGTSFTGSTFAVFEGTYPGITGTTTVRTRWNGSVEGLNALVNSPSADPSFLNSSVLTGNATANGTLTANVTTSGNTTASQAHLAFSDVNKAATPYGSATLEPATPNVGVVVFSMIANDGAPLNLTNVTQKQFEALFRLGIEELSLFTGNATDNGKLVFASGRNDGSGTRTTYMAETGAGILTLVNQYIGGNITTDEIGSLKLSGPTNQPSTIWNQNVDGNGGYSSGGDLNTLFQAKSSAVDVYLTSTAVIGVDAPDLPDEPITLITFLTISDSVTAIGQGAKALSYNGVGVTPANPLSAEDQDKVKYGAYTAWGFQTLYRRTGLTANQLTIDADIRSNIPANIGAAGIQISTMAVSRAVDGGIVTSN